jgi:hypothetical protein
LRARSNGGRNSVGSLRTLDRQFGECDRSHPLHRSRLCARRSSRDTTRRFAFLSSIFLIASVFTPYGLVHATGDILCHPETLGTDVCGHFRAGHPAAAWLDSTFSPEVCVLLGLLMNSRRKRTREAAIGASRTADAVRLVEREADRRSETDGEVVRMWCVTLRACVRFRT